MYKNKNVMIDIETLSTSPNAIILTIGAIVFETDETIDLKVLETDKAFYRKVSIQSCKDLNMDIDSDTEKWWNQQNDKTRYEAIDDPTNRLPIQTVLKEFSEWLKINTINNFKIWANSPSFDCVILKEAYKACKLPLPWKFWLERDIRTLFDITDIKSYDLPNSNKHNALYDCYRQISGVQQSYQKLI
jgi:hypothetical protein